MDTWPYFLSPVSRAALKQGQPVPVASCWNGMVVFDAAPFYDEEHGLEFRGIADDLAVEHLEGSECCLIHADNPLSGQKGVWVDPNVRVTYNGTTYSSVSASEKGGQWPSTWQIVTGLWKNRLKRWGSAFRWRDRSIEGKVEAWRMQDADRHHEHGAYCLIDEMQIMLWNGWGHA
jgi:hypothetical protein